MATESPVHRLQHPLLTPKKITGWYIVGAVLFIVLGICAIVEPRIAGLSATLLIGWLLIFGGVAHMIGALKGGGAGHVIFQVLVGILYVIAGLYFLGHPFLAISTLTLMLASVVLAEGLLEVMSYFRLKEDSMSRWLLFDGLIALLLGSLILFHWPSSSIWAIGTLVGVKLLMAGLTRLMFGISARKLAFWPRR